MISKECENAIRMALNGYAQGILTSRKALVEIDSALSVETDRDFELDLSDHME